MLTRPTLKSKLLTGLESDTGEGYNPELTARLFGLVGPWLARLFRLQVTGLENLSRDRPGIVAFNHNAGLWGILDVTFVFHVFYNLVSLRPGVLSGISGPNTWELPVLGWLAPRIGLKSPTPGSLRACLDAGHWVFLAPGGNTDMLRPIWMRNRARFQQSRFVGKRRVLRDSLWFLDAALERGTTIYPVAISGTHEMTPILWESPTLLRWTGLRKLRARETLPGFPITLNHFLNTGLFALTPLVRSPLAWLIFLFLNWYVDILYMYPIFPLQVKIHFGERLETEAYPPGAGILARQEMQRDLHRRLVETVNADLQRLDRERWSGWRPSPGRSSA